MVYVGIDDTDTPDSPGTNQLARRLAAVVPAGFELIAALRHQLFFDPRVPYTSKNGCASLLLRASVGRSARELLPVFREEMRAWYIPGSDPGLCVCDEVADAVTAFGRRAQTEIVTQREARDVARRCGAHLEGLGGTEDGVIGALAAVGLLAAGDDGRVVNMSGWPWPDEFAGWQPVEAVRARGVHAVLDATSGTTVEFGTVDIGKHLRPSLRGGRVVLFVERVSAPSATEWRALKLS
jgi:hypothetical protein